MRLPAVPGSWLLRVRLLLPLLSRPHMTALAATMARTCHGHVHFKHHEQQIHCQAEGHLQESGGGAGWVVGGWGADKLAGMQWQECNGGHSMAGSQWQTCNLVSWQMWGS